MKIMTFNIQHGVLHADPEKRIDLKVFAEYIKRENPDILGINEIRGAADESLWNGDPNDYNAPQAKILAELTGMNYYFAPAIKSTGNGLYGNALLTKFDILSSEKFLIKSPPEEKRLYSRYEDRCLLKATLDSGEENVTVFVCHMGLNPQEQLAAIETVCFELDRTEGKKILMGDFNMTPDDRFLSPIFERMKDTEEYLGENVFTFPSDAPNKKIDYIFASEDFKIKTAFLLEGYVSDHKSMIASIE